DDGSLDDPLSIGRALSADAGTFVEATVTSDERSAVALTALAIVSLVDTRSALSPAGLIVRPASACWPSVPEESPPDVDSGGDVLQLIARMTAKHVQRTFMM